MNRKQFLDFREARRHSLTQPQQFDENKEPFGKLHPQFRHWNYLRISGFDR